MQMSYERLLQAQSQEIHTLAQKLDASYAQRETLQKQTEQACECANDLERRVYEANKQSLDLLKRTRDLELENDTLKGYIIDLKARVAIYVPIQSDPVDLKMAEFINNYPDRNKLKIMFMREQSGVYSFGSKKVTVSVEKNKIQIRVGGGFLSIDEFLDQHTPVELEKIERRDPLKRFSERVAMQKTVQGHETK